MDLVNDEAGVTSAERLISARSSVRAFLRTPVARETVLDILRVATRAPSGSNIQPWRAHVVTGEVRDEIVARVCAAYDAGDASDPPEYAYYPTSFFEPYLSRRRANGWGLYSLLGIEKGDKRKMFVQQRRNFELFDAPVGIFFTIDRRLSQGSWLDYGMFLQNVMLAAVGQGLGTCPQAAWLGYHRIVGELLQFDAQEQLVCGMALGHPDPDATANRFETEREDVGVFVVMHDALPSDPPA